MHTIVGRNYRMCLVSPKSPTHVCGCRSHPKYDIIYDMGYITLRRAAYVLLGAPLSLEIMGPPLII
jgi:hypothetical protein